MGAGKVRSNIGVIATSVEVPRLSHEPVEMCEHISTGILDRVAAHADAAVLPVRHLTTIFAGGGYPASLSIGRGRRFATRWKWSNTMSSIGFGSGYGDESPSLLLRGWPGKRHLSKDPAPCP